MPMAACATARNAWAAGDAGWLMTSGTPSFTARIISTPVYGISAAGFVRSRFSTSRDLSSSLGKTWLTTITARDFSGVVSAKGMLAAVALSFVSSATYLVNDVFDTGHDRRHAGKRERPIAAGDLTVGVALCAAAALAAAGLAIGFLQGTRTGVTLLLYVGITFLYSAVLKAIPVVDVLILSGLYILRIVLGIVAIDSAFSPWLLAFAGSLFLSIALAKRYTEVARYGVVDESVAGRGYSPSHAHSLRMTGLAAGGAAIALFALYLLQDAVPAALYARIDWLWAIVALLAVWLARIWFVAAQGRLQDDPMDFALRDRVSLALGGAVAAAFLAAG